MPRGHHKYRRAGRWNSHDLSLAVATRERQERREAFNQRMATDPDVQRCAAERERRAQRVRPELEAAKVEFAALLAREERRGKKLDTSPRRRRPTRPDLTLQQRILDRIDSDALAARGRGC